MDKPRLICMPELLRIEYKSKGACHGWLISQVRPRGYLQPALFARNAPPIPGSVRHSRALHASNYGWRLLILRRQAPVCLGCNWILLLPRGEIAAVMPDCFGIFEATMACSSRNMGTPRKTGYTRPKLRPIYASGSTSSNALPSRAATLNPRRSRGGTRPWQGAALPRRCSRLRVELALRLRRYPRRPRGPMPCGLRVGARASSLDSDWD